MNQTITVKKVKKTVTVQVKKTVNAKEYHTEDGSIFDNEESAKHYLNSRYGEIKAGEFVFLTAYKTCCGLISKVTDEYYHLNYVVNAVSNEWMHGKDYNGADYSRYSKARNYQRGIYPANVKETQLLLEFDWSETNPNWKEKKFQWNRFPIVYPNGWSLVYDIYSVNKKTFGIKDGWLTSTDVVTSDLCSYGHGELMEMEIITILIPKSKENRDCIRKLKMDKEEFKPIHKILDKINSL